MIQCRKCGLDKPDKEYYIAKQNKTGRQTVCKQCRHIEQREYRQQHQKQIARSQKIYQQLNKKKSLKYHKEYYQRNKESALQYSKMYRHKNRNVIRQKKYNITQEIFDSMMVQQNNSCAICHTIFTQTPDTDHDHTTGIVRGLLCRVCNRGLGLFQDRPILLLSAAKYLNHKETELCQTN